MQELTQDQYAIFDKVATIALDQVEIYPQLDEWVEAWHDDDEYDINIFVNDDGEVCATVYKVEDGYTLTYPDSNCWRLW